MSLIIINLEHKLARHKNTSVAAMLTCTLQNAPSPHHPKEFTDINQRE